MPDLIYICRVRLPFIRVNLVRVYKHPNHY